MGLIGKDDPGGRLATVVSQGLYAISALQADVAEHIPGAPKPGEPVTPAMVRTYCLAMVDETMELLHEFNWKPWKLTHELDAVRITKEMTDIIAFMGVLLNVIQEATGVSPIDIGRAYLETTINNIERAQGQVEGYGANKENL